MPSWMQHYDIHVNMRHTRHNANNVNLQKLKKDVNERWPSTKYEVNQDIRHYCTFRDVFTIIERIAIIIKNYNSGNTKMTGT